MTTAFPGAIPSPVSPPPPPLDEVMTVADLIDKLGGIPPSRIRMKPLPGMATEMDVIELEARENRLFELIDGILVEKGMGFRESLIAAFLIEVIRPFVRQRKLGLVTGPDGFMRLSAGRVRLPDVAFISWGSIPGGRVPKEPIPSLVPDFAIEVLSESNTRKEMAIKRRDYLGNGGRLVWELDPGERVVDVYSDPRNPDRVDRRLREGDIIDAANVLPGFSIPVREIFAVLDEQAPEAPRA